MILFSYNKSEEALLVFSIIAWLLMNIYQGMGPDDIVQKGEIYFMLKFSHLSPDCVGSVGWNVVTYQRFQV